MSLDFSSYTSYDFLISKERTPNSQKSARISIYSKLISDSVTWVPGQLGWVNVTHYSKSTGALAPMAPVPGMHIEFFYFESTLSRFKL